MSISALVIGYGSIGQRHARILSKMDGIDSVTVLSQQADVPFPTIRTLSEVGALAPDYVVIASSTAKHFEHLSYLEQILESRTILVEKPLFDRMREFVPKRNSVWVAYMLRAHPLLQLIKESVARKMLWNVNVSCCTYLPDWRPTRDYRSTYSASKAMGGGVLLDVSHELDYVQWLVGDALILDHVFSGKVSSLEIDSDDLLILNSHTKEGTFVQIILNYFTRRPKREIIVDGEDISIHADLITKELTVHSGGEVGQFEWADMSADEVYRLEHEAVLAGDGNAACTYESGLETMQLIERIRSLEASTRRSQP